MSPHGPASSLLPVTFSLYPKSTHREGLGGPRGEAWSQAQPIVGFKHPPGRGRAPWAPQGQPKRPLWVTWREILRWGAFTQDHDKGVRSLPPPDTGGHGPQHVRSGTPAGSLHRRPNAGLSPLTPGASAGPARVFLAVTPSILAGSRSS